MPKDTVTGPDLSLIVGPGDTVSFITACEWPDRRGRRVETCLVYAVVHRRYGEWTHVYRVVQNDRSPGHLMVYLEKALEGDRVADAREWTLGHLDAVEAAAAAIRHGRSRRG